MMFFLYTYDVVARYLFEVEFPHSAKVPNDETKTQIDKRNGRQPAIFLISPTGQKKNRLPFRRREPVGSHGACYLKKHRGIQ